jgi:hypothetical protein
VYAHVSVGVFTRTPLIADLPGVFNFSVDGRNTLDQFLAAPVLKVGKTLDSFLLFCLSGDVDYVNRDNKVRSTIIPVELG